MKNSVENGINVLKRASRRAAPWALTASLTAQTLIHPGVAAAQTSRPAEAPVQIPSDIDGVVRVYPQCGGQTASDSETVMVIASFNSQRQVIFEEFPIDQKPGECGNPNVKTSSIVIASLRRSELSRPDVVPDVTVPFKCPDGTVQYRTKKVFGIDGVDAVSPSGDIDSDKQIETQIKVHTDLIPDGTHIVQFQGYCVLPQGPVITAAGGPINYAVSLKP